MAALMLNEETEEEFLSSLRNHGLLPERAAVTEEPEKCTYAPSGIELKPQIVRSGEIEPEEWVPIRYARDYFISNWGRVYSYRSDKYLKPRPSPWGYAQVCLSTNGERIWAYVHRMVAEHFIPGEDEDLEVNHIDGDKLYNNEINLEWVTKRMNNKHAFDTGLRKGRGINVRINETDVVAASIKEAADLVGMTPPGVKYALKNGTKTRDGWSFSYVD